jgi:hypothetical protein
VRPRSASDWRQWWADGGERELRTVLLDAWPPLRVVASEDERAHLATRLATLLGSRASVRALAAELGRMRAELGVAADPTQDETAAAQIAAWFPAGSVGSR